jgi:predicted Zn finger-like uncharacterized protein
LNPIQVNCPECQKLYLVRPDDLAAGDLTFQCQDCKTYFGFSWPQPPGTVMIKANKIIQKETPQENVSTRATRVCFKCEAKVDASLFECPKCGVIFEKAKKVTAPEPVMGSTNPDVMAAWEAVKTNYGDEKRHES